MIRIKLFKTVIEYKIIFYDNNTKEVIGIINHDGKHILMKGIARYMWNGMVIFLLCTK